MLECEWLSCCVANIMSSNSQRHAVGQCTRLYRAGTPVLSHNAHTTWVQDIGCSKRTASASPSGPVLLCCYSQAVCWPSSCCRSLAWGQLTERSDIAWSPAHVGLRMGANKQCVCQWHVRNISHVCGDSLCW